ncbi:Cell wall integrity/stress response component-like protein [Quillaja saponaria]|uniref:Cell wall integrity/stress response component-like protein n=1 Tax=Quillaja saponaria TaxID=32244 RepID=A0AAD7KTB3_QUISA|nr:Cell wall integrity/stress response component-like protein [Quillaja saponaria]
MAPLMYFGFRKVLVLYLLPVLFVAFSILSASSEAQLQSKHFLARRRILEADLEEHQQVKKKTTTLLSTKNQTKLIKPNLLSSKNQTKSLKSNNTLSTKNQTKLIKTTKLTTPVTELKKLNSTTKFKKLNSTSKSFNSTKPISISTKKSSDLSKQSIANTKTTKPTTTKETKLHLERKQSEKPNNYQKTEKKPNPQKPKKQTQPSWIDQEEDDDLVSDFRDMATKFQQTLIPDLEVFSTTSKAYISKANNEMTKGFKSIVGNKYASTIASVVSCAFILIPLLLVSLIFNRIKAYFSIQKILIFIQVYLSIYFSILCLSSLITGLEPLKFFYATSRSTYVCLQVLQTLGYALYLLLLLMYLILAFSTDCDLSTRILGLGQTFVGLAVGLHGYVTVFHRVVLNQPPKTNWKIHGIYATCFLVICLFATAERRKKAYLEDGGEEGKNS